MTLRAVIYDRLSEQGEDPDERLGVVQMLRRMCEAEGWEVVEELTHDIGASGWQHRRKAPGFDALLDKLKSGRVNVVVAEEIDRLFRHDRYREPFWHACVDGRVRDVATVSGGGFEHLDPVTPEGEEQLREAGAAARRYSEALSRKKRTKYRERAGTGRWGRGSGRPFGYDPVPRTVPGSKPGERTLVPNPAEAGLLKEAAARIMRSETLTSVVRDLNGRGVRTPAGNPWTTATFRRALTSLTVAGRRQVFDYEYVRRPEKGDVVRQAVPKEEVQAEWPAILDPALREAVEEKLRAGKRSGMTIERGRRYPLTGLLHCGGRHPDGSPCRAKLLGTSSGSYGCSGLRRGCGKLKISAARLEEHVFEQVYQRWLAAGAPADDGVPRAELTEEEQELLHAIAAAEAEQVTLAEQYVDLGMTPVQFQAANRRYASKIDDLRGRLRTQPEPAPAAAPPSDLGEMLAEAEDMDARWARRELTAREVEELHDWAAAYAERITVQPAPGKKNWDPGRIAITWRGDVPQDRHPADVARRAER